MKSGTETAVADIVSVDWQPERSVERLRSTLRRSLGDVVIDAAIAASDQVMSALRKDVSEVDTAKQIAAAHKSLEMADRYLQLLENELRPALSPSEVPF